MQDLEIKLPPSETRHLFGTQNDHAQMFQLIFGYSVSQIIHTAAFYSLAEHLAEQRSTPAEIAEAESLHPDSTFRLMRACASVGLMTYDGHSRFAATPLLNTLRKDNPNSLRSLALIQMSAGQYLPWGNLNEAIKTGEPQAVATLGRTGWEYLAENPPLIEAFTDAMKSMSSVLIQEAARMVDTKSIQTAVDIGGATGTFIHSLMQANPALRGVVFDLPHVVPAAIKEAETLGLQNRFSVVDGSIFASSPPPADMLLLKLILHDWNDEGCLSILKNCRRTINPGGRILVVERLVGEIGEPGFASLIDLTMLVVVGGRERTLNEYKALFTASGFRFSNLTPTSTPFVLIEAVAA